MMRYSQHEQEIKETITSYVHNIRVPELNLRLQPTRGRVLKRVTSWAALAIVVFIAAAFIPADDVWSFYQQVFVNERSQRVASMDHVLQRAPFQVWAPEGELIELQDLGADATYSVLSKYIWKETREIVVMQNAGTSIPPATHTAFWEGARILDDNVIIQGQRAVMYETPVIDEKGVVLGWSRKLYVILNGTALVIFGAGSPELSREELIAIGESLRPATP
jgi:hypothetical protein